MQDTKIPGGLAPLRRWHRAQYRRSLFRVLLMLAEAAAKARTERELDLIEWMRQERLAKLQEVAS